MATKITIAINTKITRHQIIIILSAIPAIESVSTTGSYTGTYSTRALLAAPSQ
jgi:hypothetical protein